MGSDNFAEKNSYSQVSVKLKEIINPLKLI